jgi:hypothetical protein
MFHFSRTHTARYRPGRRRRRPAWLLLLAALLLVPGLVTATSLRPPLAHAWDTIECTPGFDCPGDDSGGSVGLDNGDCLWDSCGDGGDGSPGGDPDPQDQCTDQSCTDGQNPPAKQCAITVKDDGTIVCTVTDSPPPDDCSTTGNCPDPITEEPVDPATCEPSDQGNQFLFNADNFFSSSIPADPFPDLDPLTSCTPPPVPPPSPGKQFGATDVAFGDSFMSGEGAGSFGAAPGGSDCDVSSNAWPNLVYGSGLRAIIQALFGATKPFENWSCQLASISDVTNEIKSAIHAGSTDDNATGNQFAGLGASTQRVQIDAGGNDVGFARSLNCAFKVLPQPNDRNVLDDAGQPCVQKPADFQLEANDLIPELTALYKLAANTVPGGPGPQVEAAGYPMLFPVQDTTACGWLQTGITRADQRRINEDTLLLDNAIQKAAAAAGARFVDFSSALQGATICDRPPGVNTLSAAVLKLNPRGAFHPNARGYQRLADAYVGAQFFGAAGASAATPANGTLVADRTADHVYVAAGGTLFPFANQPALVNSMYKNQKIILEPSDQVTAQLTTKPADGTLLKDDVTGDVFAVSKGALFPFGPSPFLASTTVPDSALAGYPIADGSFLQISGGDGTGYEVAGGAPVPVTDFSHVGGQQPTEVITQAQFDAMPHTPADGTLVTATVPGTTTSNAYVFAGGAPLYISNWSHVGGQPATPPPAIDQTAIDNAGGTGVFSHIRKTPADGTYVTAAVPGSSTASAYVFAGGAPVYISDWSHLGGRPTGTIASIDQTAIDNAGTGGVYSHILPTPPDGTYLTGHGTGDAPVSSYVIAGGAPLPITDWTHLGGPDASDPPAGINPVAVDESALDNAGTGGVYNHLRAKPADGTILAGNADKTSGIFVMAGGAPIYVSNWEDIGGARGSVSVDQTAIDDAGGGGIFSHLSSVPADNTLIESFGTGHIFVVAGGAPLKVSSLADIGSPAQTPVFVDQVALDKAGSGGFYNHLNFTPADNTLLAGNGTNMFVVAGGGPVYVSNLEDIGGARGFVTVDQTAIDSAGTGGDLNHLRAQPADGTIIESFNTGRVYQVTGGVPILDCSAAQTFLYIDQVALDKAGTGGFYNHLKPLPSPPPPACPAPTPTSDPGPPL